MKNLKLISLILLVIWLCSNQVQAQTCGIANSIEPYNKTTGGSGLIAHVGDILFYNITVDVPGGYYPIYNGEPNLFMPDGGTFISLESNLALQPLEGTVYWSDIQLDGVTPRPEGEYTVSLAHANPGKIVRARTRVFAKCDRPPEGPSDLDGDPNATTNADTQILLPCIDITKTVQPGFSKVGDEVVYTIEICNCGNADLTLQEISDTLFPFINIQWLQDNHPDAIELAGGEYDAQGNLSEGECYSFTIPYEIQPGDLDPLVNEVCVEAHDIIALADPNQIAGIVTDCDIAEVDLVHPEFEVEMDCPGFSKVGDPVCYDVVIMNTGDCNLVVLDLEHIPSCEEKPVDECFVGLILQPGESCTTVCCFDVQPGAPNPLLVCVEGLIGVEGLDNTYPFSECCPVDLVNPEIDLEKAVDPNVACPGDTVIYTICIENTGDWPLDNVAVNDPLLNPIYGSPLPGFPPVLFPGEIYCADFPYTIPPDANIPTCGEGVFENCAEVTANAIELGNPRDANDCAEICCPDTPGGEGCTPGFWKNNGDKHGASAWCERFSPSDPISMHFSLNEPLVIRGKGRSTITDPTLLQALNANGGGVNAMIRHGIAAMLNACSDCVQYEYGSEDQVITMIEDALNGVGAYTVGELHSMFAEANEAGCPVNQHGECVGVEDEMDG